jgi:DNA-binding NarL/FixJ family response regulator
MRIVIAEDSGLVREGLTRLLSEAGFEVVAEATNGDELVRVVDEHRPDLVLTDIRMPPTNTTEGLQAAHRIRRSHPSIGIMVLSQYVETRHTVELLEGGEGVGYLLKDRVADTKELVEALRRVADGGAVVDTEVVARLMDRRRKADPLAALTAREREILSWMAQGRSNSAICDALTLSPKTVEGHVARIFMKLGLEPAPDDHRRVLAVLRFLRAHPETAANG